MTSEEPKDADAIMAVGDTMAIVKMVGELYLDYVRISWKDDSTGGLYLRTREDKMYARGLYHGALKVVKMALKNHNEVAVHAYIVGLLIGSGHLKRDDATGMVSLVDEAGLDVYDMTYKAMPEPKGIGE